MYGISSLLIECILKRVKGQKKTENVTKISFNPLAINEAAGLIHY